MASKTIIYSKQSGELPIPLTIRIEWQPDGVIKPLLYWTPDGTCYEVKHIYNTTPLAFIKDRGEGIRLKVKAEIIETPEPYSEQLHNQCETYIYLDDSRFCGKNFIDDRYGHAGKEYIPVTLDIFPDGDYELICFKVHGMCYMVEKTLKIEPRGSFNAGGVGIWHKVEARLVNADDCLNQTDSRTAAIYFEINKWFVSLKTA